MRDVTAEVVELLASMESLPWMGEPVSQLEHSLQAGSIARSAGADTELVLAAVLHDIGRAQGLWIKGDPHELAGERWCRERFSERLAYLVGSHVAAKRVLVASEPDYDVQLTATSTATLRSQGGPASAEEVTQFLTHPWAKDAIALRRADESAKRPGGASLSLDEVASLVIALGVPT